MKTKIVFVILATSVLIISGSLVAFGASDNKNKGPKNDPNVNIVNFNECIVNLPPDIIDTITMSHYADWRPCSDYRMVFQGIPNDEEYGVKNTENYGGWCIDYGTIPTRNEDYPVKFYSTYCPPDKFELDNGLWNMVNYLLNYYNCPDYNSDDILQAIYYFVNYGPWDKEPWDELTEATQEMVTNSMDHGDFVPVCGQIVAVICDNNPEDEDPYALHEFQYFVIEVPIPCEDERCTLTQGYWKTHADPTKKKYDATWDGIGGPDALFFTTGISYIDILWMSSEEGNAYLILAHQYIATELNSLYNEGLPPEIETQWLAAQPILNTYGLDLYIPKDDDPNRAIAIGIAGILDDFNNGLVEDWPHCED